MLRLLRAAPLVLVLLAPVPAWADLHDEFRACMYEFYPRLRKAGAPTAVTPPDQFCLGFAYWSGTGPVPKDPAQSARWWGQAARQGHPAAQTMLAYQYGRGLGVARSDAEAVRLLRAATAQGYGDGMFNLGDGFGKGACGAAGGSWGGGGCRERGGSDLRSDAAGPPRPEPLVSSV